MPDVDDLFTPAGFVTALERGVEPTVYLTDSILSGVTVSKTDLICPRCDGPIDVPKHKPARYVATNKALNEGLCERCDPVVGPRVPP